MLINNSESEWKLIGSGTERNVYIHPLDPEKVIKVSSGKRFELDQNMVELCYYYYMARNGVNSDYMVDFFGSIQTSIGFGLVFDFVKNEDGSSATRLRDALKMDNFCLPDIYASLEIMRLDILKKGILFYDPTIDNFLLKKMESKELRPIIVDGLGGRKFNLKFHIRSSLPMLARIRTFLKWLAFRRALYSESFGVKKPSFMAGFDFFCKRKFK